MPTDIYYWTITAANMRRDASTSSNKVVTVPAREKVLVVYITGEWAFCFWRNYSGWIYFPILELYTLKENEQEFWNDVVEIDVDMIPKTPQVARQYLVVDKKNVPNYNLCGQFCSAFIGQDSIKDFLEKWKVKSPANYRASVTIDRGTGVAMVRDMLLSVYGKSSIDYREGLRDKVAGILISPGRIAEKLKTHDCIIGVKIDNSGRIKSNGIGHWVCMVAVEPFGINNGDVKLYNPFPNTFESITYQELLTSMEKWSGLTGLWIPKNQF